MIVKAGYMQEHELLDMYPLWNLTLCRTRVTRYIINVEPYHLQDRRGILSCLYSAGPELLDI